MFVMLYAQIKWEKAKNETSLLNLVQTKQNSNMNIGKQIFQERNVYIWIISRRF